MPGRDEWKQTIARIQDEGGPATSTHMVRLYALALEDGASFLRSFRNKIDDDRIRELVHDLVATKLDEILSATEPRAFFCASLRRKAISWLRRGDAMVEAPPESGRITTSSDDEERRLRWLYVEAALQRLPARDRDIISAVAAGEEREHIARAFGTSRANVDQIISRFRKRLAEEDA